MKNYNETEFQKELISLTDGDFDKRICERFPKFFIQRHKDMTVTAMCWGFEIGPGWRPLIWSLCEDLEVITKPYDIEVEFTQIKEKYGGLRAYHSTASKNNLEYDKQINLIEDIVDRYEELSYHICDETGRYYKNRIVSGGWYYACCFEAFSKRWEKQPEIVQKVKEDLCTRIQLGHIFESIRSSNKMRKFISTMAQNGMLDEYLSEKEIGKLVEYDFWLDYDTL